MTLMETDPRTARAGSHGRPVPVADAREPSLGRPAVTSITMLIMAVVFVYGCGASGRSGAPGWIQGASRDYPAEQYLTGLGQADARPAAEERAYAAVARIFRAEITAQSRDWESFLVQESRGTATSARRVTLEHVTRVTTDKVLENVRVLDAWTDPRTGQHYVLAGVNRAQAGSALAERIAELDRGIAAEVGEARQSTDKLGAVRHLRRALKDQVLREALNADLRVIRTSGQGDESRYRVAELADEVTGLLHTHFVVDIEVSGDHAEVVRRAITEGLVREGMPVGHRHTGAASSQVLLVKGVVKVWGVDVPDPQFRFVRWCSDFTVLDGDGGRVLGAVSKSGREGHLTVREATAKAVRVMQQEVASDLARTLAGYVYGETELSGAPSAPAACPRDDRAG